MSSSLQVLCYAPFIFNLAGTARDNVVGILSGLIKVLAKPGKAKVELKGPGAFEYKIVGEAKYQRALETICGGRTEEGIKKNVQAILIPESYKPQDKDAVRVSIQGHTVGYLSKVNARNYRKKMEAAGFPAKPAACSALIVGGWDYGRHDRGHFGVKLDLPVHGGLVAKELQKRSRPIQTNRL